MKFYSVDFNELEILQIYVTFPKNNNQDRSFKKQT